MPRATSTRGLIDGNPGFYTGDSISVFTNESRGGPYALEVMLEVRAEDIFGEWR